MRPIRKRIVSLLLASAFAVPAATTGCAEHHYVRVYDPYYSDYHYWNPDEDTYYRRWLGERHYEYQEFSRLPPERQKEYWTWRHQHGDHDHDHDHDRH